MRRAHPFLVAALLALSVATARAAPCPSDDPNQVASLGAADELRTIVETQGDEDWTKVAARLDRLRGRALELHAATQLAAWSELAATLRAILSHYDGTERTAKQLRVADLKPETCPNDAAGLPRCAWSVLGGRVEVPHGQTPPWRCEDKLRFAHYLAAARALVAREERPWVEEAAEHLAQYAAQWERYVADGYSQYPHEILLNGWLFLDRKSWAPPSDQLIALHPAVGFGTANLTRADQRARSAALVLAVEGVGYVRYVRDFRHHAGVSVAAVLPNFEWSQVGIGPVVHFDGVGVGYAFGLRGAGPDTLYVLLDLTRSIDDAKLADQAGALMRRWMR